MQLVDERIPKLRGLISVFPDETFSFWQIPDAPGSALLRRPVQLCI